MICRSDITYRQLRAILEEVGYEYHLVYGIRPGVWTVVYYLRSEDANIALLREPSSAKVPMGNIVSIRVQLDARGLANEAKWLELVAKHAEKAPRKRPARRREPQARAAEPKKPRNVRPRAAAERTAGRRAEKT